MEADRAIGGADGVECERNRTFEVWMALVDGRIDHRNDDVATERKFVRLRQRHLIERVLRQLSGGAVQGALGTVAEVGLYQPKPGIPAEGGHDLAERAIAPQLVKFTAAPQQRHQLRLLAFKAVPARKLARKVARLVLVENDQHLVRYGLGRLACRQESAPRRARRLEVLARRIGSGEDGWPWRPAWVAQVWSPGTVIATGAGLFFAAARFLPRRCRLEGLPRLGGAKAFSGGGRRWRCQQQGGGKCQQDCSRPHLGRGCGVRQAQDHGASLLGRQHEAHHISSPREPALKGFLRGG